MRHLLATMAALATLAALHAFVAPAAVADDSTTASTEHVVLQSGQFSVRIGVAERVSMASTDWLSLALVNDGDTPVELKRVYCRIECAHQPVNPDDGSQADSGLGLGSGHLRTLFPGPTSDALTIPAHSRMVSTASLSDLCAARLGSHIPADSSHTVTASVSLKVTLADGRIVKSTLDEEPTFSFQWSAVDEAGWKNVMRRVRALMAGPSATHEPGNWLAAALQLPGVRKELTRNELLDVLARRGSDLSQIRTDVAAALAAIAPGDAVVRERYLAWLAEPDCPVLGDLSVGGLWDAAWWPVLVTAAERAPKHLDVVLWLATHHRDDASKDQQLAARLATLLVAQAPVLTRNVNELAGAELVAWGAAAIRLAQTGHVASAALLRPALDSTALIVQEAACRAPGPVRVCDQALLALQGLFGERANLTDADTLIAAMKARLDGGE